MKYFHVHKGLIIFETNIFCITKAISFMKNHYPFINLPLQTKSSNSFYRKLGQGIDIEILPYSRRKFVSPSTDRISGMKVVAHIFFETWEPLFHRNMGPPYWSLKINQLDEEDTVCKWWCIDRFIFWIEQAEQAA